MASILYNVSELTEGLILANDIYFPGPDKRTLLSANTVLTPAFIRRIDAIGIDMVFIKDPTTSARVTELPLEHTATEAASNSIPSFIDLAQHLVSSFGIADAKKTLSQRHQTDIKSQALQSIRGIIEELKEKRIDLVHLFRAQDIPYLYHNAGSVTFLSLLLGFAAEDIIKEETGLDFDEDMAQSLAVGALFHDAALATDKYKPLCEKNAVLTDDEREVLQNHPIDGVRIIKSMGFESALSAAIIREHHRNPDGTGYPDLKNEDGSPRRSTHILSRIVRLADQFIACTGNDTYRAPQLPIVVLHGFRKTAEHYITRMNDMHSFADYLKVLNQQPERKEDLQVLLTKLKYLKGDFAKKIITKSEYYTRLHALFPQEYVEAIDAESGFLNERVIVDAELLQRFLRIVPPFPLGDEVTLSNGNRGTVVRFDPAYPCLPSVRVTHDEIGIPISPDKQRVKILSSVNNQRDKLIVTHHRSLNVRPYLYSLRKYT